ncbi:MAG: hypothetical protein M3161_03355 [Actinomycetota bacterium]|nr:hypothetical protein [Actinomycetota bacterium]
MRTADIAGHQRKVVRSEVRPLRSVHGRSGIPLRDGQSLPFVVSRGWNAPAGYYPEGWYLVVPDSGEVLYASDQAVKLIWGLPSITDLETEVTEPVTLEPGTYLVVFALGGMKGGELEVEAFEATEEAA